MLDWLAAKLKQKDGAHPLGSEAGLRRFLDGVPTAKPAHVLDELGPWLGDPERLSAELSPAAFRRAVRSLDEFAQAAADLCWTGLFAHADEETAEEFWLPLGRYYGQAAAGYQSALQLFPPEAEISAAERTEFGLCALRAMMALAQRNKLLRMRYRAGGPEHWSAVHEVYRQARARGIVAAAYTPYPGARGGGSVESQYARALLFEAAPLDNLSARQMEVVDRFLRLTADQFLLREAFEERAPFLAAIQSAAPPVRWSPKAEPPADSRFVGPGLAMGELYQALSGLQRGNAPEWVATAPARREAALQALQLLRDSWSAEPPRRRFPRKPEQGDLLSVHGFAQVRRMVAVSAFIRSGRKLTAFGAYSGRVRVQENYFGTVAEAPAAAPQPDAQLTPAQILQRLELAGDKDQMDRWQLTDASLKGLGAVAPFHKQWQRIGALVGFRREDALHWEIGVIRRLGRNRDGRRLVGVELLPGIPAPIHVKAVNEAEAADIQVNPGALAEFGDGILVSTETGTLVLPPGGRHGTGDLLLMVGENLRLLVRLGVRLETSPDFDLFRYQAP